MNKFRLEFRRFLTICRLLKEGDRGKLFERKIDTFLKKKKKKDKAERILEAEIKVFSGGFRSVIYWDCSDLSKTDLKALCDPLHGSPWESDFLDHTRQLMWVSNAQGSRNSFQGEMLFLAWKWQISFGSHVSWDSVTLLSIFANMYFPLLCKKFSWKNISLSDK